MTVLGVFFRARSYNASKQWRYLLLMLRRHVLRKLYRRRCIGAKHTAVEHCFSGLPVHLVGDARKAFAALVREDIVLIKKTHYGLQVSINPDSLPVVQRILGS